MNAADDPEKPVADALDQQRAVVEDPPDPLDGEAPLEAPEADVADQRTEVTLDDD